MANIAIVAELEPGISGGTANFLLGLIHGLAQLQDKRDRFTVIGTPQNEALLRSYMGSNQTFIAIPTSMRTSPIKASAKRYYHQVLSPLIQRIRRLRARSPLPGVHIPGIQVTPHPQWSTISHLRRILRKTWLRFDSFSVSVFCFMRAPFYLSALGFATFTLPAIFYAESDGTP